ncbi:hypothetical protein RDWZM_009254 [Blomia tropicalis]|uniref:Uncharacterized protein n=1 Tax=Blomia tropicalis TaxID=40697 RepID=A0A9Q0M505_BLOTA|nr:hypothetical protein BLOT_005204 [Blomia tropicalis]KAJ6218097.1 hypothetical protein RDWZM_009254 [Blomia tropicalis]
MSEQAAKVEQQTAAAADQVDGAPAAAAPAGQCEGDKKPCCEKKTDSTCCKTEGGECKQQANSETKPATE